MHDALFYKIVKITIIFVSAKIDMVLTKRFCGFRVYTHIKEPIIEVFVIKDSQIYTNTLDKCVVVIVSNVVHCQCVHQ